MTKHQLVIALSLVIAGCAPNPPRVVEEIEFGNKTRADGSAKTNAPGKTSGTSASYTKDDALQLLAKVNQYKALKAKQDWKGALDVIRDIVRRPVIDEPSFLADVNGLAIGALGNYADHFKVDLRQLDREALDYYKVAKRHAGTDGERRAQTDTAMGLYYSKTARNGFAIGYIRNAIDYYTKAGNRFHAIKGYADLASVFGDRGELELEGFFRAKAMKLAGSYFRIGKSPPPGQEWIFYSDLIRSVADDAAGRRDVSELERLWPTFRKISATYFEFKPKPYVTMAELFAIGGDVDRARKLLAEGREKFAGGKGLSKDLARRLETDMICTEARINLAARNFDRSVDLFERCFARFESQGMEQNPSGFIRRANALEGAGRFDRALASYAEGIRQLELGRSSFSVAERAAIFNSSVAREPYWGRIRILAARARQSGRPADFYVALRATEQIRARQFGELLGDKKGAEISTDRLRNFAATLDREAVVLNYTLMDDRIVLLAFTRTRRKIAIIPYQRKRFAADMRSVRKLLANPESSVSELDRRLADASKVLLAPVGAMVESKRRILVLQDGAMNLVPFGLLSATRTYEPIVLRRVVEIVPSLRFAVRAKGRSAKARTRGLFAVGDPVYKRDVSAAPGLDRNDMKLVSRGSAYLKYFARLPGTRSEVQGIATTLKRAGATTLYGRQATESAIKAKDLSRFRYIHLATHGVLGGEIPGVSEPALVFADETKEDGLLKASEASKLKLNADLTVLSACNTGSGRLVVGEGVLGMSRAFLLAGSRSVVVSLWPVADATTALLMKRLYQKKHAGGRTADALRAAALEVRKRHPHPVFWAPFIVIGG